MKIMIKNRSMVNHSVFSRGIKYDNMNILTWTILKNTQILNGCETFAFKYICILALFLNSFVRWRLLLHSFIEAFIYIRVVWKFRKILLDTNLLNSPLKTILRTFQTTHIHTGIVFLPSLFQMKAIAALLLFVGIIEATDVLKFQPRDEVPSWCKGLDCPAFKVLEKTAVSF